jgi:hypothetical protein
MQSWIPLTEKIATHAPTELRLGFEFMTWLDGWVATRVGIEGFLS